jgi:integrase
MKELPKKHAKKRGPVEVIQGKNTRIPIYDAGAGKYIAAYYAEGKRKLVKFQSLEAAKGGAKEIIEKLTTGIAHVAAFTPKQTAAINDAADALRPTGVTLTEAVRQFAEAHKILAGHPILQAARFYSKHLEEEERRGALTPITLPELAEKFMASIRGKKSKRYEIDLDTKLKKAARAFSAQIREIQADDIDAWLSSMTEASGRTKNNYRMALLTLFSYARDKRHLPRGERTEAEFSTRYDDKGGNIGIYTPEQFRILLTNINEGFLPFVALGGFAGLRSIEILRLDWQDIWFDKGVIEVGKDKAKTATRRLPPILPALEAWLKPHAKSSGRVIPTVRDEFHFTRRFKAATDKLIDAEGRPLVRMVHNGLRHSFCSYRLAVTKSAAQVALEAGNSPKMLFENYRQLVTEKDALAYFGILPNVQRPNGKKLAQNFAAAGSPVGAKSRKKLLLSEEAMAA